MLYGLDYLIDKFSYLVEEHSMYAYFLVSLTSIRGNLLNLISFSSGGLNTLVGAINMTIQIELTKIMLFRLGSTMIK